MEAANALTSLVQQQEQSIAKSLQETVEQQQSQNLVDNLVVATPAGLTPEDLSEVKPEASSDDTKQEKPSKRFIPEHKKPDAALTFPEKLMNLMKFAESQKSDDFCVAWLPDGKSFVIRNPDEFTRQVLPKYFKATKFSSFTRKLYRWGFRQVNRGIGPDDPIIFGNEYFQRDNLELMAKMRSVTAASTRKAEQNSLQLFAQKRALENMGSERDPKRVLLDQLMQQQKIANQASLLNSGLNMGNGMNMNLTNALRPNLQNFPGSGMGVVKPFDLMGQNFQPSNPLMNAFPQTLQMNMNMGMPNGNSNGQFPNAASTADIVNAAINALRYAP